MYGMALFVLFLFMHWVLFIPLFIHLASSYDTNVSMSPIVGLV